MRRAIAVRSLVVAIGLALPLTAALAQDSGSAAAPERVSPSMTAEPAGDAIHHPVADPVPVPEPEATTHPSSPATEATAAPPVAATPIAETAPPVPAKPVFDIGIEVRNMLPKVRAGADASDETKALSAVYASRRDDAIWVTATGLNDKGASAIAEIKQAGDWGLEPSKYVLPDLPAPGATSEIPRDKLADAEMKISFAVLGYARDARGGRIMQPSTQLSSYLDREPQLIEPRILLEELAVAANPGEFLRNLHPKHSQFEKLRQKLLDMKSTTARASEIVRLPSSGPKLVPGIKHKDIVLLRKRLGVALSAANGSAADETIYDLALVDAVKAYQEKQGQKADGIVGKATRAALNDIDVPDPERLVANMEQWRWMPADLGETYITVNIPEFMVRVVRNGKIIFEERVVTGQLDKQTPVFSDALETIYFHPRWNVPESIKVRELYPSLARGGGSFQRQGLKLMRNGREVSPGSVDWSQADIRNFDVFQPSGEKNVLGLVKFVFPNKHGVYMHDTTAKALFAETSRPFSHGCMRVRNPLQLAEALLAIDKSWPSNRVSETLDGSADEVPVVLDNKIPVHVTYFTDVIGADGEERIYKDVYGHEQRIKLALAGRFGEINIGSDHLAPVAFRRDQYAQSPDDWGAFFGGPSAYGSSGNSSSNKNSSLGDFLNNVFGGFDQPAPAQKRKKKAQQ